MQVEISLAGDVQVRRKLLRIGDRAVHARPAFEAIGEVLMRIEDQQFSSEGSRGSGGWEPLAASTVAQRGSAHPILDQSGVLRSSLTKRGGENIFDATDDYLRFGTHVPYAGFHQTGTSRTPRRRPLELTESDRAGMVKILQAYILGDETTGAAMAAALGA